MHLLGTLQPTLTIAPSHPPASAPITLAVVSCSGRLRGPGKPLPCFAPLVYQPWRLRVVSEGVVCSSTLHTVRRRDRSHVSPWLARGHTSCLGSSTFGTHDRPFDRFMGFRVRTGGSFGCHHGVICMHPPVTCRTRDWARASAIIVTGGKEHLASSPWPALGQSAH